MIRRLSLLFVLVLALGLVGSHIHSADTRIVGHDFYIGGTAYDWLGMNFLGGFWTEVDPLQVLNENGMDWNRVGVLIKNCPVGDPESWCSIEYAEEVMRSSRENGMRLDLFFYLSHTAAHAGQQPCPPEWESFTIAEKAEALRQYCYDTTKYYKDRGLDIEIYEIGNEIDFSILDERPPAGVDWWDITYLRENIWNKEAEMLKGAIEGVKQADPNATIVLHLACSSRPYFVHAFFASMIEFDVQFDVAGLSFYPSYTGAGRPTIATLEGCIDEIASLGKKTLISEFAYPSSPSPDYPTLDLPVEGYPLTPEGQADYVAYFLRWAYNNPSVVGVMYFYPDNHLSETQPEIHPGPHTSLFFDDTTVKPALGEFLRFKNEIRDSDNDGFTDGTEDYLGTDPLDNCPDVLGSPGLCPGPSCDGHDAWPPDLDVDREADIADVLKFKPHILTPVPPSPQRFDFDADGDIDIADVLLYKPVILTSCTP